jgi:chromosome segregation ATPase
MIKLIEDAINNPDSELVRKTRARTQSYIDDSDNQIAQYRANVATFEQELVSPKEYVRERAAKKIESENEPIKLLESRKKGLLESLNNMTDESILRDHITHHQNLLNDKKLELEKLQNQLNALNEKTGKK